MSTADKAVVETDSCTNRDTIIDNKNPKVGFESSFRYAWRNLTGGSNVDWTALFTAVLCVVAFLQWLTFEKTDRTLRDQIKETEQGQRPWLGTSYIGPVDESRKRFRYIFKNSGKTPALHIYAIFAGHLGECERSDVMLGRCGSDCTLSDLMLIPDVVTGVTLPKFEKPEIPPGATFCVTGRIDYEDASGTPHHTNVCYSRDVVGNPGNCEFPHANEAD